jgi:hypothetical protein
MNTENPRDSAPVEEKNDDYISNLISDALSLDKKRDIEELNVDQRATLDTCLQNWPWTAQSPEDDSSEQRAKRVFNMFASRPGRVDLIPVDMLEATPYVGSTQSSDWFPISAQSLHQGDKIRTNSSFSHMTEFIIWLDFPEISKSALSSFQAQCSELTLAFYGLVCPPDEYDFFGTLFLVVHNTGAKLEVTRILRRGYKKNKTDPSTGI